MVRETITALELSVFALRDLICTLADGDLSRGP